MIDIQHFSKPFATDTWHFIAGNGFVPGAYNALFDQFPKASIQSPLLRPLWDSQQDVYLPSWTLFVDDLEDYIQVKRPKVVIGHSIGASLWLLAAQKFNIHFDKVILIEPVVFPKYYIWLYECLKLFKVHRRVHPMIKKTLNRQRRFESKQQIVDRFSSKALFFRFSEPVLDDFISACFEYKNSGYELVFSPEWEAEIYDKMTLSINDIWKSLGTVVGDVLLLKAQYSDVITTGVYRRLLTSYDHIKCIEIADTSHLLPFEQPAYVAKVVNSFIND